MGSRVVGFYEFGAASGRPVLALHGTPACGAGFSFADDAARGLGLRVIAPDRPGVGLSSPEVGWGISTYPAMIDDLADALGIDRFSVWGYSGGGPYAVACAALLADRLDKAAVCAGAGQVGVWAELAEFEKTDRQMLEMSRRRPRLARILLSVAGRVARVAPSTVVKSFEKELSASDRAVVASYASPAEAIALFTQALLHGSRGVVDDYRVLGGPWNVDLTAITVPTRIFQGTDDTMVPLRHSKALADRVATAELIEWPGEGHLATVSHVDEVLGWLAE
ncbi:MAG: alpha/beta fold hydrolase [Acidimicrobiales bacterium]